MSIDLVKEFEKKSTKRSKELSDLGGIEEIKLLMESAAGKERDVLRAFGLDENIVKVENLRGQVIESEKFAEEYGNSISRMDIGTLAITYRMRFLPLSRFKGAIDPTLASRIIAFATKHNIDPVAYADSFYVLAPAKDFRLDTERHRKPRPIVSQDPILFYKTDKQGSFWTIVHKWGTEFNFLRMINSLKYRSDEYYAFHWAMIFFAVLFVAGAFLLPATSISLTWLGIFSAILGFGAGIIKAAAVSKVNANNLFSELNWTDSRYHVEVEWND